MSPAREVEALARAPFVPFDQFLARFTWRQGEHVSVIGPTGSGKSTLVDALLPVREQRGAHVLVLGTKPKDPTLDRLVTRGYTRVRSWPPRTPWWQRREPEWDRRLILWPTYRGPEDRARMVETFDRAFRAVFPQGGRTIVVDEAYYMAHQLGLAEHLVDLWTQGRSLGLTLVAGTQRPAYVPLYMYDQATHLFLFADNDETNLRRVGGLGGLSAVAVRETVAALPHHEVLYVNTRTRELIRTRVR